MLIICRRPLFREEVIISHSTGRGQQAFQWRNSSAGMNYELDRIQSDDAIQCTGRLFIEPIQWMGQSISTVEGKVGRGIIVYILDLRSHLLALP